MFFNDEFICKGDYYIQLEMEFKTYMSQVLRIPKTLKALPDLEVEWVVGPIPIQDENGKELS